MEKKKITELNAVAAVMDSIFQQVDERWGVIWLPAEQALRESGVKLEKKRLHQIQLFFGGDCHQLQIGV